MFGIFNSDGSLNEGAFKTNFSPSQRLELHNDMLRNHTASLLRKQAQTIRELVGMCETPEMAVQMVLEHLDRTEIMLREIEKNA